MDINEFNIEFDEQALLRDLINALANCVQVQLDWMVNNMRASNLSETAKSSLSVDMDKSFLEPIVDEIIGYVSTDAWQFFVENYGTGSLLDRNNPWLDEYLRSGLFNPLRSTSNFTVVGREEGDYTAIDGSTRHSSGLLKGENLEQKINEKTGKPFYTPQQPKHALENAMQGVRAVMSKAIEDTFNNFDFTRYLKGVE